jgi:uracil-DNA glycosylase
MIGDLVHSSWIPLMEEEFKKEYLQKLAAWLAHIRQSKIVYPDSQDVFRSLKLCPYTDTKVIILGQEPYYQGNADGLAFSYKDGFRAGKGMQALDVIFAEIERDCYNGFNVNMDYQLDYLAKQGVLLLNAVLTVFRGQVGSHKDIGWQKLTVRILKSLMLDRSPKVFMLWGTAADNIFLEAIRNIPYPLDHLLLKAHHPAYDLHKRDNIGRLVLKYPDGFSGCAHFSQANRFLLQHNRSAIDWFPVEKNTEIPALSDQLPF